MNIPRIMLGIASILIFAHGTQAQGPPQTRAPYTLVSPALTSHGKLDGLLVNASAPDAEPKDIQAAITEILNISGLDSQVAEAFSISSKLAAAELAYHNHTQQSIPESNVTSAMNHFVSQWGLPGYMKTSDSEVRKLHVQMIPSFPRYLLADLARDPNSRRQSGLVIRQNMPPLEATLLFALLVHQKLTRPEYQMTSDEYATMSTARRLGTPEPKLHDRTAELHVALVNTASHGSLRDLLAATDVIMSDLGFVGGGR